MRTMRRILLFMLGLFISGFMYAGGILTNTNQSAMFTRMQARDATIGIDAAYYNPAGISFLPNDGLYLSLNNQTLGQTRTIGSNYSNLNQSEYIGNISVPFFPGLYAAYKTGSLSFSVGFNPIGGGGGGVYDDGIPYFEYDISDLATITGADSYSVDAYFEGSSVYFGYQANISYQINDMISVAAGVRYIDAKESYNGYLKGIALDFGGTSVAASTYFTNASTSASGAATSLGAISDAGYGTLTFAQAEIAGIITAEQRAQLEGGLSQMGLDPSALNIAQSEAAYSTASAESAAASSILADQEAEYEKSASGITPIISVNLKLSEKLNIALKYEHKTALEFTNSTTKDLTTGYETDGTAITQFPDGEKTNLDIPAQIVVGATYKPIEKLMLTGGIHYYFDKNANWDGNEDNVDANLYEFAFGAEYTLSDKIRCSAGYLNTTTGVNEDFQDGLSYSLSSNSIGAGLAYNFNPMIELNLGGSYTMYTEGQKSFIQESNLGDIPTTETYNKDVWVIAVGLNLNFSASK